MPRRQPRSAPCKVCLEPSDDLRLGLCFRCYQRHRRGALVVSAKCALAICDVQDPRMLVAHPIAVLCANHARLARRGCTLADVARLCEESTAA